MIRVRLPIRRHRERSECENNDLECAVQAQCNPVGLLSGDHSISQSATISAREQARFNLASEFRAGKN
jgi:hypothetical protein